MSQKNKQIIQQPQHSPFVAQHAQFQKIHSGPLPPAEELIKYNDAFPDAANRIIIMAELQQQHRFDLEKRVIDEQLKQSSRGQIFGFILGLIGLIGSVYAIISGYEVSGTILGGTSLTALVSLFVIGKREQKKSLEAKEK